KAAQNGRLVIICVHPVQDTIAWTIIFDPGNGGIVGHGGTGYIVGMTNTFNSSANVRWGVYHDLTVSPGLNWIAWTLNSAPLAVNIVDGDTNSSATAMPAQSTINSDTHGWYVCPANPIQPALAGQKKCAYIQVDGEPCQTPSAVINGVKDQIHDMS